MTDASGRSDLPTAFEMLESVIVLISGVAVGAFALPAFTLSLPGLIFVAAILLVPLVAVATVVALAGAILAIPFLLVRSIRNIHSRRATHAPVSAAADTSRPQAVAASQLLG